MATAIYKTWRRPHNKQRALIDIDWVLLRVATPRIPHHSARTVLKSSLNAMPSRQKRADKIVVRRVERGSRTATKMVLGTMQELNRHAPLEEIAPHLIELQEKENSKPWKQASRSAPRPWRQTRRNAGRDDGRTYVSRRFVCGSAVGEDSESDDQSHTDDRTDQRSPGGSHTRRLERVEVCLMDMAKPAKQRGTPRGYEFVRRSPHVMEDEWEMLGGEGEDEWESVDV